MQPAKGFIRLISKRERCADDPVGRGIDPVLIYRLYLVRQNRKLRSMVKITLFVMIFLTASLTGTSQDLILKCGDKEIACINGNKSHFGMVVYCPYEEIDTVKLPQSIKDNAKKYLTERVGTEFYSKLNYYSSQVIGFKRFKEIKKGKGWISDSMCDRRVKYSIQYYFTVQDSMRYYVSLVFDKKGNVISEDQLPDYRTNRQFGKIMSVCEAKLIAEQDPVFPGELQNISLEYSEDANTFVWRAEKPAVAGTQPRQTVRRFTEINAVNGKLIGWETQTCISGCGGDSF
jgi:hypothetical protein